MYSALRRQGYMINRSQLKYLRGEWDLLYVLGGGQSHARMAKITWFYVSKTLYFCTVANALKVDNSLWGWHTHSPSWGCPAHTHTSVAWLYCVCLESVGVLTANRRRTTNVLSVSPYPTQSLKFFFQTYWLWLIFQWNEEWWCCEKNQNSRFVF